MPENNFPERVTRVETKVDLILNNHLPHLQEDIQTIDKKVDENQSSTDTKLWTIIGLIVTLLITIIGALITMNSWAPSQHQSTSQQITTK